ncbi:MAG: hypothetical protein LBR74_08020, partial [Eubacterium sp.]|nr:hypothetical protein [Eubacterium sp.]
EKIFDILKEIPLLEDIKIIGQPEPGAFEFELKAKHGADIRRDISLRLATNNFPILTLKSNELSLEEIFIKLTSAEPMPTDDGEAALTDMVCKNINETKTQISETDEKQTDENDNKNNEEKT